MKIIEEKVAITSIEPFKVSVFRDVQLDYPMHHHAKSYELTLTLGVTGTRMVGDNYDHFTDKDLVLLSPKLPHCWSDHGISQPNKKNKVIVVQFSDEMLPSDLLNAGYHRGVKHALDTSVQGLEYIGENKESMLLAMEKLEELDDFDRFIGILKILNAFGDHQNVKRLASSGYSLPNLKEEGSKLEKVYRYINNNYTRKISINEVADQVNMSSSAFSHYFKKRTLQSFSDHVLELRLGRAAQLLLHTELPITQIVYESGFQNVSHFNRSFNKKYNTSPLKYRKVFIEKH